MRSGVHLSSAPGRWCGLTLALAGVLLLAACGGSSGAKIPAPTATVTSVPPGVAATATALSRNVQLSAPALVTLSTQARTPLAPNTYNYLWAG